MWAGYRMKSARSARTPNRRVVNRRPQIAHVMWVVERPDHHCGDDLAPYTGIRLINRLDHDIIPTVFSILRV